MTDEEFDNRTHNFCSARTSSYITNAALFAAYYGATKEQFVKICSDAFDEMTDLLNSKPEPKNE